MIFGLHPVSNSTSPLGCSMRNDGHGRSSCVSSPPCIRSDICAVSCAPGSAHIRRALESGISHLSLIFPRLRYASGRRSNFDSALRQPESASPARRCAPPSGLTCALGAALRLHRTLLTKASIDGACTPHYISNDGAATNRRRREEPLETYHARPRRMEAHCAS